MNVGTKRRLALTLLALAGAAGAWAQNTETSPEPLATPVEADPQTPPRFAAEVEQVIVDLVVTDKRGNPIAGLTSDDMTVREDGVPQTIVSFEAIDLSDDPAAAAPPPSRISTNRGRAPERGRTFVIVFDDMNLTPYRTRDAKAAVASFLKNGVREGDLVTLIATAGGTWWTARMGAGRDEFIDTLKRLDGRRILDTSIERMTDWEAMRIHVHHDARQVATVLRRYDRLGVTVRNRQDSNRLTGTAADPFVNARASDVYRQALMRNRITLEVLERALNGLASVRGRKSVVLVSEGFIYDPNIEEFKRVNAASRRANAAIYFVNARGLEGMPIEFSAQFGARQASQDATYALSSMNRVEDGPEGLADESGGFTVRKANDLDGGIRRIAREAQVYYLLGYISSNAARDGAFREIEVKLENGRGRKVRARKGYYAPTPDGRIVVPAKEGIDPVLQAALDSPWSESGIPLRMTHYVAGEQTLGKASVLLVAEVDVGALAFKEQDGRYFAEIEFLLVTAHRESGESYRYDEKVTMMLRPSTRERLIRTWYPIARDFQLQSGDHMAKIIVREVGAGSIGSVSHQFEVPFLEGFRVSTPILSDTRRPAGPGAGLQPQLLVRRSFPQGGEMICQFEVYGAARDEAGIPRVTQGSQVRRTDGTVYKSRAPKVMNPGPLGALARLFAVSLEHAIPGDYEIVLTFRDELAGKSLELREPFEVVAPVEVAPAGAGGG